MYNPYEKRTFIDDFARDIDDKNVWYNIREFGRYRSINGKKLLTIFISHSFSDSVSQYSLQQNAPFGVTHSDGVLYCRAQELSGVRAGEIINLDGREFMIAKADLIQEQVWRLTLERVQE